MTVADAAAPTVEPAISAAASIFVILVRSTSNMHRSEVPIQMEANSTPTVLIK
jgi:hypothetical protein